MVHGPRTTALTHHSLAVHGIKRLLELRGEEVFTRALVSNFDADEQTREVVKQFEFLLIEQVDKDKEAVEILSFEEVPVLSYVFRLL